MCNPCNTDAWQFAHTFDTATGERVRMLRGLGGTLTVDRGYRLYATTDGLLVP